jgi:hypothetical protein
MIRRTVALAALAGAALLTLTACDDATTGTITGMKFVARHDESDSSQCVSYGSNGVCRVSIPVYTSVPECWHVEFHNAKDDKDGDACLSEQDYKTYKVGDTFPHLR